MCILMTSSQSCTWVHFCKIPDRMIQPKQEPADNYGHNHQAPPELDPVVQLSLDEFEVVHEALKAFIDTVAEPSGPWARLMVAGDLLEVL